MAHSNVKVTGFTQIEGKTHLAFTEGTEKFLLGEGGVVTREVLAGAKIEALSGHKATNLADTVLHDLAAHPQHLPDEVKMDLSKATKLFGQDELRAPLVAQVQENAVLAKKLNKASVKVATDLLTENPEAKHLLTGESTKRLTDGGLKMADIDAVIKQNAAIAAKADKVKAELKTLLEAKKPNADAIHKHLRTNYEHLEGLGSMQSSDFNIRKAISRIEADVATHTTNATQHFDDFIAHSRAAAVQGHGHHGEAGKEAAALAKESLEKANAIIKGDYGHIVSKNIPDATAEGVRLYNAEAGKGLGSAVASAAKSGGGKWYSLMKSETELLATATKKGVPVGDLKFLQKIHPVKGAGVAAIGAVAIGYLAGVGRNPQGKHTDQVAAQQLNEQQQGAAIA